MSKYNPANLYPPTEMSFKSVLTFVVFVIVLFAGIGFGQELTERQHYTETRTYTETPEAQYAKAIAANTQAATGINNIYALVVALTSILGLIAKEFKDGRKGNSTDEKLHKLFLYSDEAKNKFVDFNGRISSLETAIKGVENLTKETKEIKDELKTIQKTIAKLVVLQELFLNKRAKPDGED